MNSLHKTKYIHLDTGRCNACWKCVAKCTQEVLGKIDLFFHKHAKIKNPVNCTGCLRCVKACEYNAIRKV